MKEQIVFTMSIVLLAILLVLLAGLAGWLFTMGVARDRDTQPAPPPHLTHSGTTTGHLDLALAADGVDVLRIDSFTAETPPRTPREPVLTGTNAILGGSASGDIPMICPQIGPEIRSQRNYPNPALHDALVDPTRVVFHLEDPAAADTTEDTP